MNSNWAEENLQTIRTLMERSALYRRALAPILLLAGAIGITTMIVGLLAHLDHGWEFCSLWLMAATIAISGSFLIARKQAFKDKEIFWSPPTRRVAQALAPALAAGFFLSVILNAVPDNQAVSVITSLIWILFYGCAVHAAGFFIPRGMKLLGLTFVFCSCGLFAFVVLNWWHFKPNPNLLMGIFFGGFHLISGIYLHFTEKKSSVA